MTYKFEITSFNHDDLVNILSTALYSSTMFDADYDKEKYADIIKDQECFEDKMAEILLHGGEITIIDLYSSDDVEDDTHYDTYGVLNTNWRSTEVIEMSNMLGDYKCVGYHIDLNTLLMGINKSKNGCDLCKTLIIDEEGDLYEAQDLLQEAIFGETIYG